jgi:hypothetical protein
MRHITSSGKKPRKGRCGHGESMKEEITQNCFTGHEKEEERKE